MRARLISKTLPQYLYTSHVIYAQAVFISKLASSLKMSKNCGQNISEQ